MVLYFSVCKHSVVNGRTCVMYMYSETANRHLVGESLPFFLSLTFLPCPAACNSRSSGFWF